MPPRPNPPSYSYADPRALICSALTAFLPPDRISTADCAAAKRYLDNRGGGVVGRWSHDKAPYLVGVMDAFDDLNYPTVAVVGPGQCGKTASAENFLLRNVLHDQADMLWYAHTDQSIEDYVKQTINPLIQASDEMRNRLGKDRIDNSLKFKRFLGMTARFLSYTHSNLVQKFAPRIIADEFDAYTEDYGDPKGILDVRRQSFQRQSKLIILSHPDLAGGSNPAQWKKGVMAAYADSDRRIWWWQCPHCEKWSSPAPGAAFHCALVYDAAAPLDRIRESAHLLCPHNHCVLTDHDRKALNASGKWVGLGQRIDEETGELTGELVKFPTAGFWIVGVMSPFNPGLGHLAAERVKAERAAEADGDYKSLATIMVKQWGIPFDPPRRHESLDATVLADRADQNLQLGTVPAFVRFITGGMDVQGNRFELLWRGWGEHRESVVIDRRIVTEIDGVPVDPGTDPKCWDAMVKILTTAEFPLADGSGRVMRVKASGIDGNGIPGVTDQAISAWRRARVARQVQFAGTISGRRAYSLLLLRGVPQLNAKNLTVVMPDSQGGGKKIARAGVPRGDFNPSTFKSILASQLTRAQPGPSYVHFPAALRSAEPPHAWFEQLTSEQPLHNGRWEPKTSGARNEALDLMVICGVMAHLHAPGVFDWSFQRVPPWAQPWDQNPLVGAAAPPPAAVGPPANLSAPPVPTSAPPTRPPPTAQPAQQRRSWRDMGGSVNGMHA